jgi:hypothetical protein
LTDCRTDATEGYTAQTKEHKLDVVINEELLAQIPLEKQKALLKVLEQDPRPSYIDDPIREYGVFFGDQNIRFTVNDNLLQVIKIENNPQD